MTLFPRGSVQYDNFIITDYDTRTATTAVYFSKFTLSWIIQGFNYLFQVLTAVLTVFLLLNDLNRRIK